MSQLCGFQFLMPLTKPFYAASALWIAVPASAGREDLGVLCYGGISRFPTRKLSLSVLESVGIPSDALMTQQRLPIYNELDRI